MCAKPQTPQPSQAVQNATYNTNSNGLVCCDGGRKNHNYESLHGGMTPLHMACVRGHMGVVIGLVEDKADVVSIDQVLEGWITCKKFDLALAGLWCKKR